MSRSSGGVKRAPAGGCGRIQRDGGAPWSKERMQGNVLEWLPATHGHFRYESGYHGELWLDLDRLFVDPRRVAPHGRELASRLGAREIEAVVGPLTGGAFLAQMIAAELGAAFAYAAPEPSSSNEALFSVTYRLPATVAPLLKGKRVAIVDDVVNAGSALRGTFHALVETGATPAAVGALVVLGESVLPFLEQQGLALERLASLHNPLWTPSECPLCARGVPFGARGPDQGR
jgi:orotate phosphoribosyltransferase